MFLYFLLALALTAADQAVKAWTVGHFAAPAAGFTATSSNSISCARLNATVRAPQGLFARLTPP